MSDRELFREVSRWLRYAREDLEIAQSIIDNEQAMRAACFHAQQCAEKAIKATYVFLQTGFRKTHDLELLCRNLPEGWDLSREPERFSWLTVWAVETRYPGDLPEATEEDARIAVRRPAKSTRRPSQNSRNGASRSKICKSCRVVIRRRDDDAIDTSPSTRGTL